jgi:hypothetical protein
VAQIKFGMDGRRVVIAEDFNFANVARAWRRQRRI